MPELWLLTQQHSYRYFKLLIFNTYDYRQANRCKFIRRSPKASPCAIEAQRAEFYTLFMLSGEPGGRRGVKEGRRGPSPYSKAFLYSHGKREVPGEGTSVGQNERYFKWSSRTVASVR